MKRLCALAFGLLLIAGCAGEERPDWIKAASDDWNGNNMRMLGETSSPYHASTPRLSD